MKLFFIKFIPPILLLLLKFIKNKVLIYFFKKKPIYEPKIYYDYNDINETTDSDSLWESENWIDHVKNSLKLKSQREENIHKKAVIKSLQILSLYNFNILM